jgi:hypothetical protein
MQHSKNEYNGDKLGENIAMYFETGVNHYDGKDICDKIVVECSNKLQFLYRTEGHNAMVRRNKRL